MMCRESRAVSDTTMPANPTPRSLIRFSHVAPRRRPKYLGLGRASMLLTGTTKRMPSTAATRPPPQWSLANAMSDCASISGALAGGNRVRPQVALVDVADAVAGERLHPRGDDRAVADVQGL